MFIEETNEREKAENEEREKKKRQNPPKPHSTRLLNGWVVGRKKRREG